MKKIVLLIVVGLSLFPLLQTGLFNVHDPTSVIRFFTLRETLLAGQIPASWTNLLNHGYGYPLFLYYAPVFTYLGTLLSFLTPTYIISLKLSLALLVGIGAFGMYKLAGTLSAVAFTLLPYHASSLYVRGSYAELVTMSITPWLLYYWQKPLTRKTYLPTTLLTSLFLLSHNSLPFLYLPALFIWIYYYQRHDLKFSFIALVNSLFVSSWFILPIFFERGLVQLETTATATKLATHAITLSQLWHSSWGYGGSSSGVADGMSFMLGKFQLVLGFATLIYLLSKKRFAFRAWYFMGVLVLYGLSSLDLSLPLWNLIPALQIVQFPWRNLAFATFGLSAFIQIPKNFTLPLRSIILITSTFLLLFFNLKFFKPEVKETYIDSDLLSQEKIDTAARDKIPEYLPANMPSFPNTSAPVIPGLNKTAIALAGNYAHGSMSAITLPIAYMPHWKLSLNDQLTAIKADSSGLVTTLESFSPGNYTLKLTWHRSLVENIGIALSLISLIFMIGYSRGTFLKQH